MNLDHLIKGSSSVEDFLKRRYVRVQDLDRLSEPHCSEIKKAYMSRQEIQ